MRQSPTPASVTIVALLVLSLTVMNAIRAGAATARWSVLQEFAPRPGPLYILLTGAVWAIAGGALFIAISRRHPYARIGLTVAAALYSAYVWADRLLFQAGELRPNGAFFTAITLIGLAFVLFTTWGPAGRHFFEKREGHD